MDTNSNNKKYKLSFISFLKPCIVPFFIFLFSVIIFIPLMIYTYGTEKQFGAWLVAIIWISFTGIPPFVLHINYFLHDWNKCVEVNKLKQSLTFIEGDKKQSIKYEEIDRIEKYHSKNIEEKFVPKMHWHTYYYYKIVLKDKDPVYISRMILEKFEKKIKGINFKFIRVPYPFIRKKHNL